MAGWKEKQYDISIFCIDPGTERILMSVQMSGGKGQIINLGAGFDTLYWRLREAGNIPANFVELDFPSITAKKCYHIKKHKQLIDMLNTEGNHDPRDLVISPSYPDPCAPAASHYHSHPSLWLFSDGEIRFSTTELHAANYHLVGTDLRHIAELNNKLTQAEVNFNLPTMFLAECVLVYVDASATSSLLKWLSGKFPNSLFVSYEQVNMKDKFGQVMLSNLRSRGCLLAGVEDCESLETQQRRWVPVFLFFFAQLSTYFDGFRDPSWRILIFCFPDLQLHHKQLGGLERVDNGRGLWFTARNGS